MKTAFITNGTLALKPYAEKTSTHLRLVTREEGQSSLYDQILDQIFSHDSDEGRFKSVNETLANLAGAPLLRTRNERVFAAFVSVISCIALFYFSFFAF